jgi:D-alanine-D-alanine ligase
MVYQEDWEGDQEACIASIEARFQYPFIAKPADDGCSSAVKKIKNREELQAFAALAFRNMQDLLPEPAARLQLKLTEEFPIKTAFLIEDLITAEGASRFLEITGGLYTQLDENGQRHYVVFEASEALAQGEVLSLEEKFLAGEGQNITPARYHTDKALNQRISDEVKKVLEQTARILKVEGYARIDAFVRVYDDLRVEVIIIEVNSLPGMTPATCIFHQAAIELLKPYEFIDAILQYGMKRVKSALT